MASAFHWDGPIVPVQKAVDEQALAGAVVGVALPDGKYAVEAVGLADREAGRTMTPETLFWIASITKTIASTLALTLVDEGRLELDRPVETYLPEFGNQRVVGWFGRKTKPRRRATVADLMRHLAGLPVGLPGDDRPLDRISLEEKARLCGSMTLASTPGSKIAYGNLSYECLGRLIEVAAGAPFEDCLRERLLEPLDMRETTFRPTPDQLRRLALPYGRDEANGNLERRPFAYVGEPFDDPARTPTPAFGLFSTVGDCLRFARLHLQRGSFEGRTIFSELAAQRMFETYERPAAARYQGLAWTLSPGAAAMTGTYGTWMTLHLAKGAASVLFSSAADFGKGPLRETCAEFTARVGQELASGIRQQRRAEREAQREERRTERQARREANRTARRRP